jgi:hypothetical protein
MNTNDVEPLITLSRIFSEKDGMYLPCLSDMKTHDIDPMWVASSMYLLLDRYVSCIPENKQNEFYQETMNAFEMMKEHGAGYITKIPL